MGPSRVFNVTPAKLCCRRHVLRTHTSPGLPQGEEGRARKGLGEHPGALDKKFTGTTALQKKFTGTRSGKLFAILSVGEATLATHSKKFTATSTAP